MGTWGFTKLSYVCLSLEYDTVLTRLPVSAPPQIATYIAR